MEISKVNTNCEVLSANAHILESVDSCLFINAKASCTGMRSVPFKTAN